MLAALLREMKLWLYRESMLETGLPVPPGGTHGGVDLSQVEALQRSTLHVSGVQAGASGPQGAPSDATSTAATKAHVLDFFFAEADFLFLLTGNLVIGVLWNHLKE